MKVICPKCQFENQADSSRVVCARCATIVEVRMDQGAGYDSNGKRQTARLPFASNNSSNNSQPLGPQAFNQNKDVYATRIGDDFDDVLDVPVQSEANFSTTVESVPMFEDVFAAQSQDQPSAYDFSSYEKTSTTPIESFRTNMSRQRETQDYTEPSEQEFMGWPVLPENSADEEEAAGNNRGGLFARIGLIAGVFGALCFLAYYFLGDYILKRMGQDSPEVSANAQNTNAPENGGAPIQTSSPIAASSGQTDTGTIVTPKPQDSTVAQDPNSKGDQKQVTIQPIESSQGAVGRTGRTDPPAVTTSPSQNIPTAPNKGNLTIQVGSFKDQGEADARAARLRSAVGNEVRVVRADIPGRGTWYRLQLGRFGSREGAMSYGNQLRSKNLITEFIVTAIGL